MVQVAGGICRGTIGTIGTIALRGGVLSGHKRGHAPVVERGPLRMHPRTAREGYRARRRTHLLLSWHLRIACSCRLIAKVDAMLEENDGPVVTCIWSLRDASVAAASERGPAFCEEGLSLRIVEGRRPQFRSAGDDDATKEIWGYELSIYVADGPEPSETTQVEAMISVAGWLDDGRPCRIHGKGFIGRDDHGQIEGSFFLPPRIEIAAQEEDWADLYLGDEPT